MDIKTILIVDDSKIAHLTLRKLLTERNYAVDWMPSGELGIEYLKEKTPDIIFMNVMMPGIDGFEATQQITCNGTIHHPPVIMCTACGTDEDKKYAKTCGAKGFLTKPYTAAQLDAVLAQLDKSITSKTIPVAPPPALMETPLMPVFVAASLQSTEEPNAYSKMRRVLVVDDSITARLDLKKQLTERGYSVDCVRSGEQCLEYLEERMPDIIFMDTTMVSGMDGFETTRCITHDGAASSPIIIMGSPKRGAETRRTAQICGASGLLEKPYTSDQLDPLLKQIAEGDLWSPITWIRHFIKKVLVVDQYPPSHAIWDRNLAEWGFAVDYVTSGEACFHYLKNNQPDMIFINALLYRYSFALTHRIRSNECTQSIAIVICNLTDPGDRKIAKRAGAIGTLPHWFTVKQLDMVLEGAARYLKAMDREETTNVLQYSLWAQHGYNY